MPHATAGIAIIETGAGSDDDLLAALGDLLPADDRWRHRHGSRGHGRSHVMPAIVPPYATVPVLDGRLALGTWQSVCLVDLNVDNAVREVRFSFLSDDWSVVSRLRPGGLRTSTTGSATAFAPQPPGPLRGAAAWSRRTRARGTAAHRGR